MTLLALVLAVQASLPPLTPEAARPVAEDWLVADVRRPTGVWRGEREDELVLTNGLIRRVWRLRPDVACVAFDALTTGESLLRAVEPEARVKIDGVTHDIGGLVGQPDRGFLLPRWLDALERAPGSVRYHGFEVLPTEARMPWLRKRWSEDRPWPPPGAGLRFDFGLADAPAGGVILSVHYEMYDGIPLVQKWVTVINGSHHTLRIDDFVSEVLAVVEAESMVEPAEQWHLPSLFVISDYAFHGMDAQSSNVTTRWSPDPRYTTQVNYRLETPVLLTSEPPESPGGPAVDLGPGESFESFRTFELVFDSTDRERRGLAIRRMFRTVAPWVTENPVMMHVRHSDDATVRAAIDQCAEVGFEMVILTFGSGFDLEDQRPETLARWKALADYAHERGIELGGYSLLSSRSVGPETDVIDAATGEPGGAVFGSAPCLGSAWGQDYFRKLYAFFEATGFDLLEHDGSYPGDACASTEHPGHRGHADSQWRQSQTIRDFYRWCRGRGIYLNVPDFYFLSGSSKTGMGYRETNWSLPREQQLLHGRQNVFDGTWTKTPSMGWMFVPLTEYHGGGAAATLEPLSEHLDDYAAHLANNFGFGVQACYRGPRLFDSAETQAVVKQWVDFYKRHRAILDSDLIHVRRADGRDVDCMLHVNPRLPTKGLALVFNPLDEPVHRALRLPLYYTGLTELARVRERDGNAVELALERDYSLTVDVALGPRGVTWLTFE